MSAAAPNQPGTQHDPRKAAGDASPAAGPFALTRWADPEWPLFVAVLLLPALLVLVTGQFQKASFFAGAAVYAGVLKWLGWLVFTRPSLHRPAFVLFPLEMFLGLALLCGWFYLRNLAGWLWPMSYGLLEL